MKPFQIKQLIQSYGISPVKAMYNYMGTFDEMERRLYAWKEISLIYVVHGLSYNRWKLMCDTIDVPSMDEEHPNYCKFIGNYFDYETIRKRKTITG